MVHDVGDMVSAPLDLAELDLAELEAALAARGQERFRGRQVFAWIYRRGVTDVTGMTDRSKSRQPNAFSASSASSAVERCHAPVTHLSRT